LDNWPVRNPAYYPVELSQAIRTVLREEKTLCIIGLPCTLKRCVWPVLTDNNCGNAQCCWPASSAARQEPGFSAYLAAAHAIAPEQIRSFSFREKIASSSALPFFRQDYLHGKHRLPSVARSLQPNWLSGDLPAGL